MSKKRPVRGSEPEEAYEGDLENALMLDEPGTIVEPDVRKALLKYFKDMKMLEGIYLSKRNRTYAYSAQQEGVSMKITKRQLKQIIQEMITDDMTDIDLSHYDAGYEDGQEHARTGNMPPQDGQPDAYYAGYDQGLEDYEFESGTGRFAPPPGGRKPEKIPGVISNKPRKNSPHHPRNMGNPFYWD